MRSHTYFYGHSRFNAHLSSSKKKKEMGGSSPSASLISSSNIDDRKIDETAMEELQSQKDIAALASSGGEASPENAN